MTVALPYRTSGHPNFSLFYTSSSISDACEHANHVPKEVVSDDCEVTEQQHVKCVDLMQRLAQSEFSHRISQQGMSHILISAPLLMLSIDDDAVASSAFDGKLGFFVLA